MRVKPTQVKPTTVCREWRHVCRAQVAHHGHAQCRVNPSASLSATEGSGLIASGPLCVVGGTWHM